MIRNCFGKLSRNIRKHYPTLTLMRPMSTYVDLTLNRVEFKIMACILLEKSVYHIAALKYTIV